MRTSKKSRVFVIDASLARACGLRSQMAIEAAEFLRAVIRICHRAVLTNEITEEWLRHQSGFFVGWLSSMFAKRKHLRYGPTDLEARLREKVSKLQMQAEVRTALEKDLRLVAAALSVGGVVASLDEQARKHFRAAAASIGELRSVEWVNPNQDAGLIAWLEDGAPPQPRRQLGG